MVEFENINISAELFHILNPFKVNFAFQPIFSKQKIWGYEALMRPQNQSIVELIYEMKNADRLHELELLTFFGATKAFRERNLVGRLCINSFPNIVITESELNQYIDNFKEETDRLVVEILEYKKAEKDQWEIKNKHISRNNNALVSLDDFGAGENDISAVDLYKPHIIKFDRSLIADIDKNTEKQLVINGYIKDFHKRNMKVLAEGIERQEELDFLMDANVDLFQGYYLGMPR